MIVFQCAESLFQPHFIFSDMPTLRSSGSGFSAGLFFAPPIQKLDVPAARLASVVPAELPAVSELQQLYPLRDLNQTLLDTLRPVVFNSNLLMPATFYSALNSLPESLGKAALSVPLGASAYGRAAGLVSGLVRLVNQGMSYQAAILEA